MPISSAHPIPVRPRVLVTGGAGYIGSILTRLLLADGYDVRVLDAFFYGADSLEGLASASRLEIMVGDTRDSNVVGDAMRGVDQVVHLAEIVGDPACALDPPTTVAINYEATRGIAEQARDYGVRRLVYPSSCSVYGATEEVVDEDSVLNPVSLYAQTKVRAEATVSGLKPHVETVILRLATVYGISPRPRFDLVVNQFAAQGLVDGEIAVHGGDQWRPFVHVVDVAHFMKACLEAPSELVAGRMFNVGSDQQNHTVGQVAELVRLQTAQATVRIEPIEDHRNYRVSFARAGGELGFRPRHTVSDGIRDIQLAVVDGKVADYRDPRHSNVLSLRDGIQVTPWPLTAGPAELVPVFPRRVDPARSTARPNSVAEVSS